MNEIRAIRRLLEPYIEKYVVRDDEEDLNYWLNSLEERLAEYGEVADDEEDEVVDDEQL
ncbi:hypothetical protein AGMMS50268_07650 [Spirochaetia bacterium]|nr:hypothetical protein AGMMS50268_07650 [Spirochaetia bacterium]